MKSVLTTNTSKLPNFPAHWTLEILSRMDWKRFHELSSLILARVGFEAEVAWVRPDGTTVLHVSRRSRQGHVEALVQCPGWELIHVNLPVVVEFFRSMQSEGVTRGILISPGTYSVEARHFGRQYGIELIDGRDFLGTLQRMPQADQSYYYQLATVGNYTIPTCPSCGQKMILREGPRAEESADLGDFVFKEKEYVSKELNARKIIVKRSADVLFQKGLQVETMLVEGRVMGNIVCHGLLRVGSEGCVSGLVAARAIKLDLGGRLEAEARVLNEGEVAAIAEPPRRPYWGCSRAPSCKCTLEVRK